MLRLVIGYASGARAESPKVLYCGNSGAEAQKAIDKATSFARVEVAEIPVTRRAKRSQAAVQAQAEQVRAQALKRERAAILGPIWPKGEKLPKNLGSISEAELKELIEIAKAAKAEHQPATQNQQPEQ